jgi:hypothetical protein
VVDFIYSKKYARSKQSPLVTLFQTHGYKGAVYKKFASHRDAQDFISVHAGAQFVQLEPSNFGKQQNSWIQPSAPVPTPEPGS